MEHGNSVSENVSLTQVSGSTWTEGPLSQSSRFPHVTRKWDFLLLMDETVSSQLGAEPPKDPQSLQVSAYREAWWRHRPLPGSCPCVCGDLGGGDLPRRRVQLRVVPWGVLSSRRTPGRSSRSLGTWPPQGGKQEARRSPVGDVASVRTEGTGSWEEKDETP